MKISLSINPKQEIKRIVDFLNSVKKKTRKDKIVIGLSGGIDSTTVYYLLQKAYKKENIIGVSLPYEKIKNITTQFRDSIPKFFSSSGSPSLQRRQISQVAKNLLSPPFSGNEIKYFFHFRKEPSKAGRDSRVTKNNLSSLNDKIRLGNIIARVRMIILFDLAKKYDALVCGTENKSERLLGYFTRFGDAASDIEPISHLYKTQVRELAKYLKVPQNVIDAPPSAGLWKGQTDEKEFGFTYKEADQVLYLYYDKNIPLEKIPFKKAKKIVKRFLDNQFKHNTPYKII